MSETFFEVRDVRDIFASFLCVASPGDFTKHCVRILADQPVESQDLFAKRPLAILCMLQISLMKRSVICRFPAICLKHEPVIAFGGAD